MDLQKRSYHTSKEPQRKSGSVLFLESEKCYSHSSDETSKVYLEAQSSANMPTRGGALEGDGRIRNSPVQ